jgi:predicted metal-dependent hydrolase
MQSLEYILKKNSGRYLRIQVKPGGIVEVFKPRLMPMFLVERFLRQKRSWILEKIEKQKQIYPDPYRTFGPFSGGRGRVQERRLFKENKEKARKLVYEKLELWQRYYRENHNIYFHWNKVAIKNSKTRWGSCSSRKNLNFSYKIFFLDSDSQDYLIVHELSHLLEMNHSKNFWELVALGVPSYKIERNKLKNFHLKLP